MAAEAVPPPLADAEAEARAARRLAEIRFMIEAERERGERALNLRLEQMHRLALRQDEENRMQAQVQARTDRERAQVEAVEASYENDLHCAYDHTMLFSIASSARVGSVRRSACIALGNGRGYDQDNREYINVSPHILWCTFAPRTACPIVLPVTVTDHAGRFPPTVILVEAIFHEPANVLTKAAIQLAPVHALADDERLVIVRLPDGTVVNDGVGGSVSSSLFVPVRVPNGIQMVYRGASALRMARAGATHGWFPSPATNNEQWHGLCVCVAPVNGELFTINHYVDAPAEPPRGRRQQNPDRLPPLAITGASVVVPSRDPDVIRRALVPILGPGDQMPPEAVVLEPTEGSTSINIVWSGALPGLHRRNAAVDPELEAAFRVQSAFAEVHDYATWAVRNAFNLAEVEDPGMPHPRAFRYKLSHPVLFDFTPTRVRPERPDRAYYRLRLRVFVDPNVRERVPRAAVVALMAGSDAWSAPMDRAYVAAVAEYEARPTASQVDADAWMLRGVEDAATRLEEADEPPDLVDVRLTPAQLRSLAFMQSSEDGPPLWSRLWSTHPDIPGAYSLFVRDLTTDPVVGEEYDGTVTRLIGRGAFVEFLPGRVWSPLSRGSKDWHQTAGRNLWVKSGCYRSDWPLDPLIIPPPREGVK